MKYPKLKEPCLSCQFKCGRVEDIKFVKDENCKYAEKKIKKYEFKEIIGEQERFNYERLDN